MINNTTDNQKIEENSKEKKQKPVNEFSSMYIRGFLKITHPASANVIVKTAN